MAKNQEKIKPTLKRIKGKLTGLRAMSGLLAYILMTVMVSVGKIDGSQFVDALKWITGIVITGKSVDHTKI